MMTTHVSLRLSVSPRCQRLKTANATPVESKQGADDDHNRSWISWKRPGAGLAAMTVKAGSAVHNRSGRWLRDTEQKQSAADAGADAHEQLWEKQCDEHREKARASALAAETTKQGHSHDEDLRTLLKQVVRQVNALALDNQKVQHRAQEYAIKMDFRFDQVMEGQMRLEKRMQRLHRVVAGEKRADGGADGCVRRDSSADNCCRLSGVPEGDPEGNDDVMEESRVPAPAFFRQLPCVPEQGTSILEPGSETLRADQREAAELTQGKGLTVKKSVGSFKHEGQSAGAGRMLSDENVEGDHTHLNGALERKQDPGYRHPWEAGMEMTSPGQRQEEAQPWDGALSSKQDSHGLFALAKEAGMKMTTAGQRQEEAQHWDGALDSKQDSHGLLTLAEQVGMKMTSQEQRQEEARLLNVLPRWQ